MRKSAMSTSRQPADECIRLPVDAPADASASREIDEAMKDVSRRIEHLARHLNVLGYFGDKDDTPKAA